MSHLDLRTKLVVCIFYTESINGLELLVRWRKLARVKKPAFVLLGMNEWDFDDLLCTSEPEICFDSIVFYRTDTQSGRIY